jgi:aryl-alcohol dehydrogenase-like predicted oxidoreductase
VNHVTVGSTGVRVSPLCFGTMSFGAEADEQASAEMYARVREAGINFFDTADVNAQGLSRRHVVRAAEASLRRLGTGWIDFYFVHAFDEHTPIEQTLCALDDLRRQGKVLYPGVSNWAAWQIAKALGISAREGLARFELVQPM